MVSTQPHYFNFPQFPSPPFHPFNPPPPPPSHSFAPPPPPSHGPPPPPSHPFSPPPPHLHPPPSPFHPIVPPPHVLPPPVPVPVPPSPSPNNHPIVIVVVFVSLGGLVLVSLLAFALCCSIKKSKKKTTTTQETEIIHVDEHKELKETIVTDPLGKQAVVLSIEDDVHIEEEIIKNEKGGHNLHAESDQGNSKSKKKCRKNDIIHVDEHKKIKENIVSGPFGQQAVVLSIEDDVHVEEEIIKNEEKVGQSLHAESDQANSKSKQKKSPEMDIIHVDEHKEIKEKIVTGPFGKQVVLSIEDDFDIEEEKIKNEEKFGHNLQATSSADQDNSNSIDIGTTSSDHEHQQQQQQIENKPWLKELCVPYN